MNFGFRKEDKNKWERRIAIIPNDVKKLVDQGINVSIQRFSNRAFPDAEYENAGAKLVDDISDCDLIFGIKEIPIELLSENKAYMMFSHTIKGQAHNMKMLAKLVEKKCTLLDYETVTDEKNKRLIFFGRFAGIAGMIDSFWALGLRLKHLGHQTPFLDIAPAHTYLNLNDANDAITKMGIRIKKEGFPECITPLVVGFTGYGHVSQGAQEILNLLPFVEVTPNDLPEFEKNNKNLNNKIVKVVYKESDLVAHKNSTKPFDLQDYYQNGRNYISKFEPHLSLLTVLINGIYWSQEYPKLANEQQLKKLFDDTENSALTSKSAPESTPKLTPKLTIVGDITCDIDGSLACTTKDTESDNPCFIYNPETKESPLGFKGHGLCVMAVSNLPCELPQEASATFSSALAPFLPKIAKANFGDTFDNVALPEPIKRSVILWRGKFTPSYKFMEDFLR